MQNNAISIGWGYCCSASKDSFLAVKENCKARPYEMEARFMQCAHDLQFIGLLKPTQRKTDHVQKCTWAL